MVTRNTPAAGNVAPPSPVSDAAAVLDRILRLEEQLARVPAQSPLHRTLTAALHLEATAYRRALDVEQAAAAHDKRP